MPQREQEHDTVKKEKRAGCGKERKHNASQLFQPLLDGPCLTHMMKEKERHKCETQRDTAREKDEGGLWQ